MTFRHFLCRLVVPLAASVALMADWPDWRGPGRDGISLETGLLERWPAGGPPLAWKATGIGDGFASFSIAEGRVFTQGQRDGKQYLIALDEQTGKKLWEIAHGAAYRNNRGDGPRGTPTIDGERVYALAADGSLVCAKVATGEQVWTTNLLRRFGGRNISWGLSESPLIDGQRLIVNAGGKGASIVALDKNNGNVLWQSQSDEAGYSSAVASEVGGLRQYILLTGEGAVGVSAESGELFWRYDEVANSTANVATPVVRGDHVFVSSDYGTGGALLKMSRSGNRIQAQQVYFNRDMRNHYSSSVLMGEHLYGYSSSVLTAMNFQTGAVAWRDRSVGKGQVIYAEGRLYLFSEDGVAGLAEANPAAYREISRFEIARVSSYPTWALPAIANGKLYLRDQGTLYSYNIRKK
jgi:outer membrane protein assembly factor BamB